MKVFKSTKSFSLVKRCGGAMMMFSSAEDIVK
jgi:hypothetical protein